MAEVLGLPIPDTYEIIFLLTLGLILVKLILGLYLAVKVRRSKKEENPVAPLFIGTVMLLMFLWAVSRTLFMEFDFFLTKFVEATYPDFPNVWFWKFGSVFASVGVIAILFIVDKKILSNKFKGVFAYIMLAAAIVQFAYPVDDYADFVVASTIGIVGSATSFLIPILFLYIGKKTPGLRRTAFTFAFGIIIYVLGGALVSASIIPMFYALGLSQTMVYLISTSMKVLGLLMVAYGTTRFHF
ncbi:MAG: hypothetical protein JW839_15805 [Candidatus Lokiarchaeota archaeon]|nr:hypothetical protein [Candidatus Lokiarchaeota archaeon]